MEKTEKQPRKDGRYEAKGVGPDGRRKSYYSRVSQEDADRKASKSFGIQLDKTLLSFYANVYIPTVLGRSDNWKEQIKWAMDKYVIPEFGRREIDTITRADAQRFFNKLGKDMKPSSLARIKIVFSGVMNLAEADEVIPRNHVRSVRLPDPQPPTKLALTPEELWKLLTAAAARLRPYVLLTGFCGLRAGEALGTTRKSVQKGVLTVSQQVLQLRGGCQLVDRLKTPQSRRSIPLPAVLEEMLLNSGQVSDVFLCSDSKGGFLTPNNAHRELEDAIRVAKIRRVTPHELRHTFISLMENDLECPPAIVAAIAGKTYQSVTAGYSHATQKQMAIWMERFWERVSNATESQIRLA